MLLETYSKIDNVQENVELEREVEQPVIELEQLGEPLYVELEQRVELYEFSGPVDPLFYIEDELIYVGEPTIPSISNNPLANLNYESDLNSNGERQRHRCHNHQCTYQSKHYYEMKRHWKRKHEDIVEIPTPDKIFTNLANGKRYQCPFQCPCTYKHRRHLRKHRDDKHKD
ncbi:hypothetical protein F8M41_018828 [Gigaspora margarita]|uniref:C2H2-type domain-containing protein n=1 Tax=Gigaspora margarita TaxID=4874 RepID=A0A8H4AL52_GIGMA|nr:hypothetical protein F8M41_018828 [Gigaspora margarita]